MGAAVVIRNSISIPVPDDRSLPAWRAVMQTLGHRTFWDEGKGVLHVDSTLDGLTVVLDPGHGGDDRTNRGPLGYVEADAMLDVALRLASLIGQVGGRVVLTRERDTTVSLSERAALARQVGADMFLSLHSDPRAGEGSVEVVYPLLRRRARRLAAALAEWTGRRMGLPARVRWALWPGAEEGYTGVIWGSGAPMAAILYLGNYGDARSEMLLSDPAVRERCAEGIYWGIVDALLQELEREVELLSTFLAGESPNDRAETGDGPLFTSAPDPGPSAPAEEAPTPVASSQLEPVSAPPPASLSVPVPGAGVAAVARPVVVSHTTVVPPAHAVPPVPPQGAPAQGVVTRGEVTVPVSPTVRTGGLPPEVAAAGTAPAPGQVLVRQPFG